MNKIVATAVSMLASGKISEATFQSILLAAEAPEAAPPVKRGPGRPKGSKNKPKAIPLPKVTKAVTVTETPEGLLLKAPFEKQLVYWALPSHLTSETVNEETGEIIETRHYQWRKDLDGFLVDSACATGLLAALQASWVFGVKGIPVTFLGEPLTISAPPPRG